MIVGEAVHVLGQRLHRKSPYFPLSPSQNKAFLKKVKFTQTICPRNPAPGIYPRKVKSLYESLNF